MTDTTPSSPLDQADAAKARRDIVGEVGALMQGHGALESAPWYPAQEGDLVHVHYEAFNEDPAWGETYAVEADAHGFLVLRPLHHTAEEPDLVGAGSFAPGLLDNPLMEAWMEAGPHALVVVRHGRIVHPAP